MPADQTQASEQPEPIGLSSKSCITAGLAIISLCFACYALGYSQGTRRIIHEQQPMGRVIRYDGPEYTEDRIDKELDALIKQLQKEQ